MRELFDEVVGQGKPDPQEAARALGFSLGEAVKAEGGDLILPPE